jgi:hypothetical protein
MQVQEQVQVQVRNEKEAGSEKERRRRGQRNLGDRRGLLAQGRYPSVVWLRGAARGQLPPFPQSVHMQRVGLILYIVRA